MRSKAPPNGCARFTCVAIKGGTEGGGLAYQHAPTACSQGPGGGP